MPKIEILIGMIASGKSTYARRRADEGAIVVCHDSLTEGLHCRHRYEPGLRGFYRQAEEDIAMRALAHGLDVVVDRTHLTLESRDRWIKFGAWQHVPVHAVVFPIEVPELHAARRSESDGRGRTYPEWLQVAVHHAEQAKREPLDWESEGFASVLGVTIGEIA